MYKKLVEASFNIVVCVAMSSYCCYTIITLLSFHVSSPGFLLSGYRNGRKSNSVIVQKVISTPQKETTQDDGKAAE